MPLDFDMVLSASPPLFSHNTFMDFRYATFPSNNRGKYLDINRFNGINCYSNHKNHQIAPTRSCLIVKAQAEIESSNNSKKRVWFADDKGMALTHVRIMTEPSDCPPRWTDDFLEKVTQGLRDTLTIDNTWEPSFSQPASDYMAFRTKLDKECVSLENVIVKDEDGIITGTIKVKNIAFDKEVTVRMTFDRWSTHTDIPASYVPNNMLEEEGASAPYDTFAFTFPISKEAINNQQIEFCVRFKCGSNEYWDNNCGDNYRLVTGKNKSKENEQTKKFVDALTASFTHWTEFASWNNLITEGPYW